MKLDIFSFHNKEINKTQEMKNDILELKNQIKLARNRFENETDSNLVDSCIYEINALQAKLGYLIKQSKEVV